MLADPLMALEVAHIRDDGFGVERDGIKYNLKD